MIRIRFTMVAALLVGVAATTAAAATLTPDEVKSRIAAVDATKYNADVVVVLDDTEVAVAPSGIGDATTQRIVKIARDGGVRSQSVQRFGYDPTTNRFTLVAVRIYRAGGEVVEVPVGDAADHPDPQWGIYWGSRQAIVNLPRLAVGDAVETISRKVGFNVAYLADQTAGGGTAATAGGDAASCGLTPPMEGHWYDVVEFWSGVPVVSKRYSVFMPPGKSLQYAVYNGELRSSVAFEAAGTRYTFEKSDIPVFAGEPQMVSAEDVACKLVLATLDTWEAKSRWFHKSNEASFKVDDEMKALVREVTANLKDDEAKITALNHWVAEIVRYVGTSRGSCEGYTTHNTAETFHDRGGVCKDKAGLLVALLREAGFDAYVVMTEAGAEVWPVPADQFNHCVSCIRNKDGSFRLLDPTWMPRSRDNWSNFAPLQHVVYGTPEGQPLARSPYVAPEGNLFAWKAESAIDATGALRSHMSLSAVGGPETNLRRTWWGRHPADRDQLLVEAAQRVAPDARVSSGELMSPIDFSGPIAASLEIESAGFLLGDAGKRWMSLPALRCVFYDQLLSDVISAAGPELRKQPMKIRCTRLARFEESIRLPEHWSVARLPEAVTLDGPAASLRFEISRSEGEIRYSCELSIKKHKIEPPEYAQFRQVVEAFNKVAGSLVELRADTATASR